MDIQALHRIRDQMVGHRTKLICHMQAFCPEYGIAIRQGVERPHSDVTKKSSAIEIDPIAIDRFTRLAAPLCWGL